MNNLRTFVGKHAPNHKEFGRWVDTTAGITGYVTKVYHNGKWVEENPAQKEPLTEDEIIDLIVNNNERLQIQIDNLISKINYLERELKLLKKGTAITEQ